MLKKIKFNRVLDLLFWGILLITTGVEVCKEIDFAEIKSVDFSSLPASQQTFMIAGFLLFVLITLIANTFEMFELTVIYIGIKIATRKYNKDRIEKVDLKNDSYYKEILPKYSPAILSYIDDFKIDKEDIVASLLMLELKKKIKLEKDSIALLDGDTTNLEENEVYILEKIKENKIKDINIYEYEQNVKKDAIKHGLVQEKQGVKKQIKRKLIINAVIFLLVIVGYRMLFLYAPVMFKSSNELLPTLFFVLVMINIALTIFTPFITVVYIVRYITLNKLDPYVRNDEGKALNAKLEGLRKYLTDFSKIEDKSKEQLILWEEYLIYSVIFRINTKVVDEVYTKLKGECVIK